jgi:hypothetical protein
MESITIIPVRQISVFLVDALMMNFAVISWFSGLKNNGVTTTGKTRRSGREVGLREP